MKIVITILLSFIVISCTLQVLIEEPEKIIEIEETEIMNDFIVKPFTEYPAYFVQGDRVLGIPANAKGQADLIPVIFNVVDNPDLVIPDTFFTINGIPHLLIKQYFDPEIEGGNPDVITKYCALKNGVVEYLTESEFPEMPESQRVTGTTGDYNIDIGDYKGASISIASRTKLENGKIVPDYTESFVMIDGFIAIEGGLLIHTPTGRGSSRPAGLLFWPDGLRTMNHWKEVGRFWK